MEILYVIVAVLCSLIISLHAWKLLNWGWFEPKRKEKLLRQMGFNGNSYRFLIGDYKQIRSKAKEVDSKPIVGFSNDISERVMAIFHAAVQQFGENCFIWLGTTPMVIILDPKIIKETLSKNNVFQKIHSPLDQLLAQGLVAHEGNKWAKHRRLINPAFQLEKLKNMLPSFYLSCVDMLSKWEKIVPSEGSCEVDVWPHLQILTSDAISRTAFGSNYEEGRKIFQLQKEQVAMLMKATATLLIPGWRFLPTKVNRRMKEIVREMERAILEIINKRMQVIELREESSTDLLGILLESNIREMEQNGNEFGMSLQDVVEECKVFYIAGQITTASLLVWTMILLGKHLDWQIRARNEVLQVLTSDHQVPNSQELSHLKVINMIFQEILRLYPPVPMLSRSIHKETAIQNMILPAGVQLLLPTIFLHHDNKIWGNDAKEFNPERFSQGVLGATNGEFVYFPFGGGPRICIGQNFAMLEAKMALAMILRHYSFEVSPNYTHAPQAAVSLEPQYGAQLILHKL